MFDRYTKIVLTIIAVALSAIAVQGTVGSAHAQAGTVHVVLDDVDAAAFNRALVPVMIVR
jgi:hypothetical protein